MIGDTNSQAPFVPYSKTIWSGAIGDTIETTGWLTYTRTGYKHGFLSGNIKIVANSASSNFNVITVDKLNILGFGVTFVKPTSQIEGGWWLPIEYTGSNDLTAYGTVVQNNVGTLILSRTHTKSQYPGGWPLSTLGGCKLIALFDIPLDEV